MARRHHNRDPRLRARLATETARIIAEEGVRDFRSAKNKAAHRLGVDARGALPTNEEIEQALADHQRLFRGAEQERLLARLRAGALELMDLFEDFETRLVGAALRGTAGEHTPIELHLFADCPERVSVFLIDRRIPYQIIERHWPRYEGGSGFPQFRLALGELNAEVTVFPVDGPRHAPPCPVDGRPMRRASRAQLERMLASGATAVGMA